MAVISFGALDPAYVRRVWFFAPAWFPYAMNVLMMENRDIFCTAVREETYEEDSYIPVSAKGGAIRCRMVERNTTFFLMQSPNRCIEAVVHAN